MSQAAERCRPLISLVQGHLGVVHACDKDQRRHATEMNECSPCPAVPSVNLAQPKKKLTFGSPPANQCMCSLSSWAKRALAHASPRQTRALSGHCVVRAEPLHASMSQLQLLCHYERATLLTATAAFAQIKRMKCTRGHPRLQRLQPPKTLVIRHDKRLLPARQLHQLGHAGAKSGDSSSKRSKGRPCCDKHLSADRKGSKKRQADDMLWLTTPECDRVPRAMEP